MSFADGRNFDHPFASSATELDLGPLIADGRVRDERTPKICREGDEPKLSLKISSTAEIQLAVGSSGSSLEVPRSVSRNANGVIPMGTDQGRFCIRVHPCTLLENARVLRRRSPIHLPRMTQMARMVRDLPAFIRDIRVIRGPKCLGPCFGCGSAARGHPWLKTLQHEHKNRLPKIYRVNP